MLTAMLALVEEPVATQVLVVYKINNLQSCCQLNIVDIANNMSLN